MTQEPISVPSGHREIIIVYGPQGCGKTTNAAALAKKYDCTRVMDETDYHTPRRAPDQVSSDAALGKTLLLTCDPPSSLRKRYPDATFIDFAETGFAPVPARRQDACGPAGSYRDALAVDVEGMIAVLDMARVIWEPDEMCRWLETPQRRWDGLSPLQLIAADRADDVLDVLEELETL